MRLTVVGCSGSFAGPSSPASCYLVQAEHEGRTWNLVLDLGNGALGALQRHIDPMDVDAVMLSHLHPDHCLDLCGLYVMLKHCPTAAAHPRIPVYGPRRTAERMARAYDLTPPDGMDRVFDFRPLADREAVRIGPFTVTPHLVNHPVEAYGFRVEAHGVVLAYTGDTDTCDALKPLCNNATLVLSDSAFIDGRDREQGIHLSGSRAARAAVDAGGVQRLMLTHLPPWNDPAVCRAQAGAVWPGDVELAEAGAVHVLGTRAPSLGRMTQHDVRHDGRRPNQLRDVVITRNWLDHAEGSVLVEFGRTRVLCAASFTQGVPRWRKGSGEGWVTAEYAMLPRATNTRSDRESVKGRIGGRTHEISRLVGRSLRAVIDTKALGENTIVLDCDVLQADGGTRTAAITGAYVALADAIETGRRNGAIGKTAQPLKGSVAAVSVGVVKGVPLLDLDYPEDSTADTDMNVVLTGTGAFVEIQGTAEAEPFDRDLLNALLDLATSGCAELTRLQLAALSDVAEVVTA